MPYFWLRTIEHRTSNIVRPISNYVVVFISFTLLDGQTVSCENGKAISIYGHFCLENQVCPTTKNNLLALTSNCSKSLNHFCPMYLGSSKICMDKVNFNITDSCISGGSEKHWKCPKANKGLDFEQCYNQ